MTARLPNGNVSLDKLDMESKIVATHKIKLGKGGLGLKNGLLHDILEQKLIAIIRG